jgi:outer membrane protein assembly factor BamA
MLAYKGLGPGDLKPAVFIDAGVVTDSPLEALDIAKRYASFELGLSVGAGLRYVTPVGPAVFDCAISPIHLKSNGWPVAGCNLAFGYSF